MAVFKCPKCNELFIEKRQMYFCPACSYQGKLIEMKISENDDDQKQRFNSKQTIDNAIMEIELTYASEINNKIYFKSKSFPTAQKKLKRLFKANNIDTWEDLIKYHKENGLRNMKGMGPYVFSSLAHLLCQTFMIEEIYD